MNKLAPNQCSVIVTTYNWPEALRTVLTALGEQTQLPREIIIADDGSREETAALIQRMHSQLSVPLQHVWQPDQGFRVAAIRNKAISKAQGDYIVFLDGDCVPRLNFIEAQINLAEPGFFVAGNRVLLNQAFTNKVLSERLPIHRWSFWQWVHARRQGYCNRLSPFISLPLGNLSKWRSKHWQAAKGCNLAVWKKDLYRVNGWEEQFSGWGYEDSDLAMRLIQTGVQRKTSRFYAPVIHLWHPENSRERAEENWHLLWKRYHTHQSYSAQGLNQYG